MSATQDRQTWILWIEWADEYGKETFLRSFISISGKSIEAAASILMKAAYLGEERETDVIGRPDKVHPGLLPEQEIQQVIDEIWPL
jgi:hypothetical protein